MTKKFGRYGRNRGLLLCPSKNRGHFKLAVDIKNLASSHPKCKGMRPVNSTRNIQISCSESNQKSKRSGDNDCNDVGLQPTTSLSSPSSSSESNLVSQSSGGQVYNPNFDLLKYMLRESYCHGRLECHEVEEITKQKENENIEILEQEGDAMETEVVLERQETHLGSRDLEQEGGRRYQERRRGHLLPMFRDFGGLGDVLEDLKLNVLMPFKCPELFKQLKRMHASPPTGILLHGPPGCGKTRLAQAVANEAGVPLYEISAPEIVSGVSGDSEKNIRELFFKASKTSPSIIFIDEIDAIAEKRENLQKGMEGRIVAQLLKCMDNMQLHASPAGQERSNSESELNTYPAAPLKNSESAPGHVLVIGATNRPDTIDGALRRPGRFTCEIELGAPDENSRYEILSLLTSNFDYQSNLDLRKMARDTRGFVGADLKGYVSKAYQLAMQKMIYSKKSDYMKECPAVSSSDDWWKQLTFSSEELETVCPTMADFEDALKHVQPSLKREGFSTIPNVTWENVGGLDTIRQEFQNCIVRPIKYPDDYEAFGDDMSVGFLLYGPPGCGKTLIAKAVANEAGASFIYIKGPELMDKYVGESELAVRKIFSRARACSPCIIFFDEVDALTANHGEVGGVVDRVLKQLLIELDGAEERRGIYVIGATNRPELMDRALLRPGRFGELLYVPLPSPKERGLILEALVGTRPIDSSVDLLAIGKSKACEHFSGADLAMLVAKATRIRYLEIPPSNQFHVRHFEKALDRMTPSVNLKQREYYRRLSRRLSSA